MTYSFHDILPIFARDERIDAVYALGSVVRDALRVDSDIDLAVIPAPGVRLDAAALIGLAAELGGVLGRQVDLGVLTSANLVYARQALLTGQCIFYRPGCRAALRAATLLGLYARFHDDRREVLHAYTA